MPTLTEPGTPPVHTVPFVRSVARLARDPLAAVESIGRQAGGDVVRMNLGPFRPYLVTHPDHVQHLLHDNWSNYRREGMLWKPVRPLTGGGVAADGPAWRRQRRLLQPRFAPRQVGAVVTTMAETITEAVDALRPKVERGRALDVTTEMTRVVHRTLSRTMFGDRISAARSDRLAYAIDTAVSALSPRLVMPFAPAWVPLPGDRGFRHAIEDIDDILYPLIRACRRESGDAGDLLSMFCHATSSDGHQLDDREIRDDVVALFVAGTETSALALTWLLVLLDAHPEVGQRVYDEIDQVVGGDAPGPAHLPDLRYTSAVVHEVLRLYPAVWIIPRRAVEEDTVGGVPLRPGDTVIVSPYLTHRLPEFWERPDVFDPERFLDPAAAQRHRFAFMPFIGGPHQCLGNHFFLAEAQLLAATLLSRYRPVPTSTRPVRARAAATLRPRERVRMRLRPRTDR